MARIRTVKPDLFINERVAACSVSAVVTYIGLFTQADDHGRHRDNAAIIAGVLWPLRAEHTPVHVEDDLEQLANAGLICRYTGCDGKRYLHITGWFEHQKIDKPSQSRLPACTHHHPEHRCGPCKGPCSGGIAESPFRALPDSSTNPQAALPAATPGMEGSGEENAAPLVGKPTHHGEHGTDVVAAATGSTLGEASPKSPRGHHEDSGPGSRILDPGSSPTGRTAPDTAVRASDLVAGYVRSCATRPPNSVLGHLGREVKKLIDEGVELRHIQAGLARYAEIQGHPSRLPSLVNDAMNAPRAGTAARHRSWTNPDDAATAYAEDL
ncbi:hypothetical protein AB0H65_30545 [Streptomyces griseoaurantiacus]|uniref:hypothetical protein n=1 Tax=Streptomyces griseoaurantiacus TaxID=68213 RepID=UPI00345F380B